MYQGHTTGEGKTAIFPALKVGISLPSLPLHYQGTHQCYAADTAKQCYLFSSLLLTTTANVSSNTKLTPTPYLAGCLGVSSVSHQHLSLGSLGARHLSRLPGAHEPRHSLSAPWAETLLEARVEPVGGQGAGRERAGSRQGAGMERAPARPSGCPRPRSPAAAGMQEPLPRRELRSARPARCRVTDLLLPAANRRGSRGRRDFIHSFIHKKEAQRCREASASRPGPPCPRTDTHGNPPRRCYPSSRRPRRTSRRRGCTERSGTGTGPPRTPWRRLRDTGPRLGQRGALPRRGYPRAAPSPAAHTPGRAPGAASPG